MAVQVLRRMGFYEKLHLENIVLSAVIVDGLLRVALILSKQIKSKLCNVDGSLIWQPRNKDYFSERRIFKLALKEMILKKFGGLRFI